MTDYSRHKINGEHSIRSLVCDILQNDGPDGHVDGNDVIAKEIWRRVKLWKFTYDIALKHFPDCIKQVEKQKHVIIFDDIPQKESRS